ncbi:polysaccharide deacetylase family protein [Phytomonospora endophytica]|uniref:Peptidoglycan/xylan/chitin deacetylase (PgdA/CDA1 family) n=1 Tax=Phytomonospora endophytica TaxID=714109 RepID=A0A841FNJ1_9ACTN|nr:polysaccharide deacetylase family protein [Phytomonospora endophytica]MBB6038881.1 peptidoglycan/xylan/chitin deacetylase (PgdA/CDA1 family) [Phytomonospora endophytica]GIG68324.1 lipoprotein [Phytomonospora endophytica]
MRRRRTLGILAALPAAFLTACGRPGTGGGGTPAGPALDPDPSVGAPEMETPVPGWGDPDRPARVVNHGSRDGESVALTFDADLTEYMAGQLDSGEVETYHNEELLAYLEDERIPATFFMTGMWAERYVEEARRIAGNPLFELANHTYEHQAFTADCYGLAFEDDPEAMRADVERTFTALTALGGNQTRYFRFPGLCHDKAALKALGPLGLTVVDGDVVSGDPFAEASQPIVDAVLGRAEAGSVVVMHLGGPNAPMTHIALPSIVDGLRERGLGFARLSEVLAG